MLSINCLNLSFCSLEQWIKDEFLNQIVNNNWVTWSMHALTYKTYNLMVKFSKCEFNNKLLDGVILVCYLELYYM